MTDAEPRREQGPQSFFSKINQYKRVSDFLRNSGIDPILYGSVGVGVYLGDFKPFDDLDLLVDDRFMGDDWATFVTLLQDQGFRLHDPKEHEFKDVDGSRVNFSSTGILFRDRIADLGRDVVTVSVGGVEVRTLKPEVFLRAYEISVKDGHRREKRGKKDGVVIDCLRSHLGI